MSSLAVSMKSRSGGERCAREEEEEEPGHRGRMALEHHLHLTPAEPREMEAAFSKITVHGGRMGEKYMRDVDQST